MSVITAKQIKIQPLNELAFVHFIYLYHDTQFSKQKANKKLRIVPKMLKTDSAWIIRIF